MLVFPGHALLYSAWYAQIIIAHRTYLRAPSYWRAYIHTHIHSVALSHMYINSNYASNKHSPILEFIHIFRSINTYPIIHVDTKIFRRSCTYTHSYKHILYTHIRLINVDPVSSIHLRTKVLAA